MTICFELNFFLRAVSFHLHLRDCTLREIGGYAFLSRKTCICFVYRYIFLLITTFLSPKAGLLSLLPSLEQIHLGDRGSITNQSHLKVQVAVRYLILQNLLMMVLMNLLQTLLNQAQVGQLRLLPRALGLIIHGNRLKRI